MNRSHSFVDFRQKNKMDRSPSQRCIYINEQMLNKPDRKQINTIFHSPFKNGRRNIDYTNPTFMSSDVIYQQNFNRLSSHKPKNAIVHTDAQNRQKALYRQRMMKRSDSCLSIADRVKTCSKSLKYKASVKRFPQNTQSFLQKNETQVFRPNSLLQKELNELVIYRQKRQLKQKGIQNDQGLGLREKDQNKLPIYLDKHHKNPKYEQQQLYARKCQLKQWLQLASNLNQIKKEIKKEKQHSDKRYTVQNVQNFLQEEKQRQLQSKKNASLLNKILKEQIDAKQRESNRSKRQKGWKIY